jgi:hypothetical protein
VSEGKTISPNTSRIQKLIFHECKNYAQRCLGMKEDRLSPPNHIRLRPCLILSDLDVFSLSFILYPLCRLRMEVDEDVMSVDAPTAAVSPSIAATEANPDQKDANNDEMDVAEDEEPEYEVETIKEVKLRRDHDV